MDSECDLVAKPQKNGRREFHGRYYFHLFPDFPALRNIPISLDKTI